MLKRRIDVDDANTLSAKKRKLGFRVAIEDVSDELVVRILSYLTPTQLGLVARVSRRLLRLANDNESWKERYYCRWIRPRVLQIPSATLRLNREIPRYSAKSANWLDHRHLVFPLKITNWKWQYRIRTNWHRGTCNVQALDVLQPPTAPVIIKVHNGIVFQANSTSIQAWLSKNGQETFDCYDFEWAGERKAVPSAMTIDASSSVELRLGIGFSDSTFRCFEYCQSGGFVEYGSIQCFGLNSEPVSVLAMKFPIVFALVGQTHLFLKRLRGIKAGTSFAGWEGIAWLQARRNYDCLPSLCLREVGKDIAASIAYASESLGGRNWYLGLQELRLSNLVSLLSNLDDTGSLGSEGVQRMDFRSFEAWTPNFSTHPDIDNRPRALSYSHPYLVAALPDNTMMVHLVTSTAEGLSLSDGRRLWGHTSGISSAEVNMRGKAVTSSGKGGEVRVWDLEGLARGFWQSRTSIPLVPTPVDNSFGSRNHTNLPYSLLNNAAQPSFTKSWIAFDDEQVLLLGERRDERILTRYDFTK